MTERLTACSPSIEKAWKRSEPAGYRKAKQQAEHILNGSVRYTGRTFHTDKSWNFEFVLVEKLDIDHDALAEADLRSHEERGL